MAVRIDTHHHAIPSFYREWLAEFGEDVPTWTPEASRRHMKMAGVSTALLSAPPPHVTPGAPSEAVAMARQLNEYFHRLQVVAPGTFGYYATLPLPDMDAALVEVSHAFDRLTADGVCLLTNYNGTYLGDPVFERLMAVLNRRQAVVFVHPTAPAGPSVAGLPPVAADYLAETVRAALNLARRGVLTRYPEIRFILAHGGGFLPFAAGRLAPYASPRGNAVEGYRLLRRFHLDTAQAGTPWALASLHKFTKKDHITYGSDFPYAPTVASLLTTGYQALRRPLRGGESLARGAAEKIFPRLVPVIPAIKLPPEEPAIGEIVNERRAELPPLREGEESS